MAVMQVRQSGLIAAPQCRTPRQGHKSTTRDVTNKAGTASAVPTTPSHTAENVGPSDCQVIFVEKK